MKESDEAKLKIELGDFKFECKGKVESMVEMGISVLKELKSKLAMY